MQEREIEQKWQSWYIAFRFGSPDEAKTVYEKVRDTVLTKDTSASVFRFITDESNYVAVVSKIPLSEEKTKVAIDLMSNQGEQSELSTEIIGRLIERRQEFMSTGIEFVERREK